MTRVLIIATDGFEQSELMKPKSNLEDAGIETTVASLEDGKIKGWDQKEWGESVKVDITVDEVSSGDYHALMLPGGQMNPDVLRMNDRVIELVREFDKAGKPIAAICHAPWLLAEANIVEGRTVTSWPSKECVQDGNLITSRNPDDIPAFSKTLIGALDKVKVSENA